MCAEVEKHYKSLSCPLAPSSPNSWDMSHGTCPPLMAPRSHRQDRQDVLTSDAGERPPSPGFCFRCLSAHSCLSQSLSLPTALKRTIPYLSVRDRTTLKQVLCNLSCTEWFKLTVHEVTNLADQECYQIPNIPSFLTVPAHPPTHSFQTEFNQA